MKVIEILKDIEESKWYSVKPTLSNYNLEDIKKALYLDIEMMIKNKGVENEIL